MLGINILEARAALKKVLSHLRPNFRKLLFLSQVSCWNDVLSTSIKINRNYMCCQN